MNGSRSGQQEVMQSGPRKRAVFVTIPRGCGKRLSVIAAERLKAQKGYSVYIRDLGEDRFTIINPVKGGNKNDSHNFHDCTSGAMLRVPVP